MNDPYGKASGLTSHLPPSPEGQVLSKTLEYSPSPVVVLDSSMNVCLLNKQAAPLFSFNLGPSPFDELRGYTSLKRSTMKKDRADLEPRLEQLRESMIGHPLTSCWHPASAARFDAAVAQLNATLQTKDEAQIIAQNMFLCHDPARPLHGSSLKIRLHVHALGFTRSSSPTLRRSLRNQPENKDVWYILYFHRDFDGDRQSDVSTPSQEHKDLLLDNALEVLDVAIMAATSTGEVVGFNKNAKWLLREGGSSLDLGDHNQVTLESFSRFNFKTPDFSQSLDNSKLPLINTCVLGHETRPFVLGMETWDSDTKDGLLLRTDLIQVWGKPVRDQMGNHVGGIVFFEDVSEKRRLEEIQRDLSAKVKAGDLFNRLADSMPMVVWTVRPDGLVDYFNQEFQDKICNIEEAVGDQWLKLIHPEDLPKLLQRWFKAYTNNTRYTSHARILYRDGLWHWSLCMALPYFDEDGHVSRWLGFWVDIEAERQALVQAQTLRKQIHNVAKHAKVLIWSVDRKMVVTLGEGLNIATDVVGKHISQLDMAPEIVQAIDTVLSGQAKSMFIQPEWKDRFYQTYLTALYDNEEDKSPDGSVELSGVACISVDMTETHKTQRALEESLRHRRELEASETAANEANRLKSEFLANTSHEIRTPIAGVLGMAELLMDTEGLTPQQKGYTISIFKSASSLLGTINQLLDYSKMESGHMEIEEVPFNLQRVIADTEDMLSHAFRRKGLKWEKVDNLRYSGTVVGDPGRLRQILTNFVSNAIKFTKEGKVRLRIVEESEDYEDTMQVKFIVQDTGIGMSKTALQRLFKPFSQADSSMSRLYGGTGLGLSICKTLVELMSGSIGLESEPGIGTTIWAMLPMKKSRDTDTDRFSFGDIAASRSTSMSPELTTAASPAGSGSPPLKEGVPAKSSHDLWILIAEDNPIMQTIAIKNLEKMGFNARAVSNGKLAVAEAARRQYDLILMDCQMPEMDGYEATRQIRSSATEGERRIPIVALTASAIRGDRDRCINSGMDDYLAKAMISKWLGLQGHSQIQTDNRSLRSDSFHSEASSPTELSSQSDGQTSSATSSGKSIPVPMDYMTARESQSASSIESDMETDVDVQK